MNINELNSVSKNPCVTNGFTFVDIANSDIQDDLLHLKYSGTCKLANQFINVINKVLDTRNFWQITVDS